MKETPQIDVDGRRRPLKLTESLRHELGNYRPEPSFRLERVDMLVFHLVWPPGRALCGVSAKRNPLTSPGGPMLCGTCAWKFELLSAQDLVE